MLAAVKAYLFQLVSDAVYGGAIDGARRAAADLSGGEVVLTVTVAPALPAVNGEAKGKKVARAR